MPIKIERELKRTARKKFGNTTSRRAEAYIYGTLNKIEKARKKKKKKGS